MRVKSPGPEDMSETETDVRTYKQTLEGAEGAVRSKTEPAARPASFPVPSEADELGMLEHLFDLSSTLWLTTEEALKVGRFRNLSRKEMLTIRAIGSYDERTMGEVAADLNITLGTLTVSVNRLIRKQYVARRRDRQDMRKVMIRLTREGKVACRLFARFHRKLASALLAEISADDREVLRDFLAKAETVSERLFREYRDREAEA